MITATPYLNALQKIPGDTASEKKKWLGKLSLDQEKASGDISQLPSEMQPLLRVVTAVKNKIYEGVTSSLLSDDVTIVRRALQARWYFDGSHKDYLNVRYFVDQIFLNVSRNTRQHIIKTLAYKLKDKQFAQEMFTAIETIYGIRQALPLILVCDEDFIYSKIKNIQLPLSIVKKLFRKNMDLIVRYLRLSDPSVDNSFKVNIQEYVTFLPALMKKRLSAFVELYEMHQKNPLRITLSNTCVNALLTNGMQYVLRKPRLYIELLPIKRINAERMEKIFPGLLPERIDEFCLYTALNYLEYYPKEKKLDLLRQVYKAKYRCDLLDRSKNVTPELLRMLPAEERIEQARMKIEQEKLRDDERSMYYETCWICYLPTAESIPSIKQSMYTATTPDSRQQLLTQMIYTCVVNKDEDALLDFMKYFLQRHKNEEDWVYDQILNLLDQSYDVPRLNDRIWSALDDIVVASFVKYGWVNEDILISRIHYRFLQDKQTADVVEMLIETQLKKTYINFERMFENEPSYKKRFLAVCIEVMEQKLTAGKWKKHEITLVYNVTKAMYQFNLSKELIKSGMKPMTINDYPWLQRTLYQEVIHANHFHSRSVAEWFREKEPELYRSWFQEKKNHADHVRKGVAIKSLKQNPQTILDDWKEYLNACKTHYRDRNVHHFVRETRWYKDLPIWFLESCRENLQQQMESGYLIVVALLLYGDPVTKLVEPLIPTDTTLDLTDERAREKYNLVCNLPLVMKLSNPPVSLELVARLCEGDYLTVALMALTNACRRSALKKVVLFAEELSDKRISVTKHGIRMMVLVAPLRQLENFLLSMWQKSKHHSIRAVVLGNTQELLFKNPNQHSWSLFSKIISTMTVEDELLFSELKPRDVPEEYFVKYIELLFQVIDNLLSKGLPVQRALQCLTTMFNMISGPVCDQLPSSYIEKLLRKYLFHDFSEISDAAANFTINSYLLPSSTEKMQETRVRIFADLFKQKVKQSWDEKDSRRDDFYPVNYIVSRLMDKFVTKALLINQQVDKQVISDMLKLFLSVLTPQMEPRSYLLLMYAQEWTSCKTPTEFGLRVGKIMPDLVETFSSMFVSFMSDIFSQMLQKQIFDGMWRENEIKLQAVDGLIQAGNVESCFIAANLLVKLPCSDFLVDNLLCKNHPAITSLLNSRKTHVSKNDINY